MVGKDVVFCSVLGHLVDFQLVIFPAAQTPSAECSLRALYTSSTNLGRSELTGNLLDRQELSHHQHLVSVMARCPAKRCGGMELVLGAAIPMQPADVCVYVPKGRITVTSLVNRRPPREAVYSPA